MARRRFVPRLLVITAMVLVSSGTWGQSYPNKPIRVVVNGPGGSTDFTARLIAQGLVPSMGQQVVVENRGGGNIVAETVARANPDGYTLLFASSTFWTQPLLQKTLYDPVKDFSPITLAIVSPNVLAVHPSVAATTVKELIALAKAKPGQLNYGSGGSGAPNHLAAELFNAMAGVKIVRVAYSGGGPAVNAMIVGEVQLSFSSATAVAPHVKSGRLRALAVTTAQPSVLTPGLPTVAASGLPGFEADVTSGMFAPAKTPEPLIRRLHQEIVRVLSMAEVKERLLSTGAEVITSSPAEFAAKIKYEMTRMGKVIKDNGITANF